jgi:hypothetical protein
VKSLAVICCVALIVDRCFEGFLCRLLHGQEVQEVCPTSAAQYFSVASALCFSECRDSISALRGAIMAKFRGFVKYPKMHAGVGG